MGSSRGRNVMNALLLWAGLTATIHATDQHPLYADGNTPGFSGFETVSQIPDAQPPPSKDGNWLGFGGGIYNNHWASSDASIDLGNIGSLVPVCQKNYDPGVSAAPLIEEGVAYYPTWSGLLVALDYKRCQTLWKANITEMILEHKGHNVDAILRSGAALASRTTPVSDGDVLFIGTLAHALLIAFDKRTGRPIDTLQLGSHPLAVLTQSPTFYQGRLFIGVSTTESAAPAFDPSYKFTHHGSMNAVALRHGRLSLLWTTHMIPPGSPFAGASVWGSQPSIDPVRQQVFIGTGQLYALPPDFTACQDANQPLAVQQQHLVHEPCLPRNVYQTSLLALDIPTGRINWQRSLSPLDAWNSACIPALFPGADPHAPPGPNCPKNVGNDTDFGMAPAFVLGSEATPHGLDIVVAGQKSGQLYALSAQAGAVLWATSPAPGGLEGGLSWGVAVDESAVYYTAINSNREAFTLAGDSSSIANSAFGAASLRDGSVLWQTAAPRNTSSVVVPIVANDVVLVGASGNWSAASFFPQGPGSLLALNKRTGEIVREVPLDAYFHAGIAAVHEYVLFGTGYAGFEEATKGSFQAWKVEAAEGGGGDGHGGGEAEEELERKKAEFARKKEELRRKIDELEKEGDELDKLRDEL